ncbi:hypothetical protein HP532_22895 [Pseudomonas sp. CrR25]|nr:hypothetical protein [Pseudomonas sp. CrR25]
MESLVKDAEERLLDWEKRAGIWYATYYALGVLSTVLLITAASQPPFLTDYGVQIVIWIAAILQGLNTFFISMQKASSYRSAWRTLRYALTEFKASPESESSKKLVMTAMKDGWQKIDEGYIAEKS